MRLANLLNVLSVALVRVELLAAVGLMLLATAIVPYWNITLSTSYMNAALLFSGLVLCAFLVLMLAPYMRSFWRGIEGDRGFYVLLAVVAAAQVAVAVVLAPVPSSDSAAYLGLAERLATGQSYIDDRGHRAFWPPGLPFFLTPFVFLFGASATAYIAANAVLFVASAVAIRSISRDLFGVRTALIATLLFAIWPSRLAWSALPAKELLTVCGLLVGFAFAIKAFRTQRPSAGLAHASGAGLALGFTALTQPGLALIAYVTPVMFRRSVAALGVWTYAVRAAVLIVATVLMLGLWSARNCTVFEGEFCGVATNGGSVFYRANNPLATGIWTAEGEIPITHLPELVQNQRGFELGKEWILNNPVEAAKLSVKKLLYFLGDDRHGIYWSVLRGEGFRHDEAIDRSSAAREMTFAVASILALAFWCLLTSLVARALIDAGAFGRLAENTEFTALLYPLLYSAAVFSVFESGDRQHMAAVGLLFPIAAAYLSGDMLRPRTR
jgi:4-amino-4-deoxy-L-arabinose transferase-like glycosyltransferase